MLRLTSDVHVLTQEGLRETKREPENAILGTEHQ